ncbi:MAG: hypothetical protein HC915_07645 [Anaerolineae bacterium]|nr:hypothetical protein [Anaerolineae bacterium]
MEEPQNSLTPPPITASGKRAVRLDPHALRLVAMVSGLALGSLLVMLDPWLRFSDVPTRINWRETLLTGIILALYGTLLSWMITAFWRSRLLWWMVLVTAPLLNGVLALWNDLTAVFGSTRDVLLFFPLVLLVHAAMVGLVWLYLNIARQLRWRRALAFGAVPLVLLLLTFLVLGRLRWANTEARDVMLAVDQYADALIEGPYEIEYFGIDYADGRASVGRARVHAEGFSLACNARIFLDRIDVECERED